MRERTQVSDWAMTPLGATSTWPTTLAVAVEICLDASQPSAVTWGPEEIVILNDAFAAAVGKNSPQDLARALAEEAPALHAAMKALRDRTRMSGKGESQKEKIRLQDQGSESVGTDLEISVIPLRDSYGAIVGHLHHIVNVTRASEDFLGSVIDHIPSMVFVKDADDLRFVRLNRAGEELLGIPESTVLGKTDRDFFPEDQAAFFIAKDREVLASKGTLTILEERVQTRGQGIRTLRTQKIGLRGPDGRRYLLGISQDITEQQVAEDKLRASELRFRTLVQAAPDAVIGCDAENHITSWNHGAQRIFGYPSADALGRLVTEVLPVGIGHYGKRQDGSLFPVETTSSEWKDAAASGSIHLVRDISTRQIAQDRLARSEERFRTISANSPVGIFETDQNGSCLYTNPRWQDMTQLSTEEALGSGWTRAIHQDDLSRVFAEWETSVTEEREFRCEYRFQRSSGEVIWVEGRAAAVRSLAGDVLGYVGTTQDITSLRDAAAAIHRSNDELELKVRERTRDFSLLAESISHLVWTIAADGGTNYFNERWYAYTGVTRGIPSTWGEVIHPEDIPAARAAWTTSLSTGQHFDVEYRLRRYDGVYRWHSARAIPVRGDDGEILKWFGTTTDIQEYKDAVIARAEAEVARGSELAAREASRLKSEFLANMSHEIRTPINGIVGITSLMLDTSLNEEQLEYANAIKSSGALLTKVINDILDFSKIEAGKLDFEAINFSLSKVVESTISDMGFAATNNSLELLVELDERLTSDVVGDPGRIRQVLTNLVGNALKFTSHGSVRLTTRLESDSLQRVTVRFEVQDTGIGMPADVCDRLFRPFMQADSSTTRKYGGSGLGLSICRHLVESMGGQIGVESVVGQGSRFWFTTTFDKAVAATNADQNSLQLHDVGPLAGRRILVVEDILINRLFIVKFLEKYGLSVDAVTNGAEAVEALVRHSYELVLMDCQMPVMDGYEATRAIRQSKAPGSHTTPIVALTAGAMKGDRERCLQAGMDDYLTKPIDERSILVTVNRWLRLTKPITPEIPATEEIAPPDDDGLINTQRYLALQQLGGSDRGFLERVTLLFIESTRAQLTEAHAAVEREDWHEVGRILHAMKSGSASLGAVRLASSAERIERYCLQDEFIRVRLHLRRLDGELEQTVQRLRGLLRLAA